jgi:hypothetical protein
MKKLRVLVVLAAILLTINVADVVSTWIVVTTGRGVEANPFVLLLGGPFSSVSLFMKLFVFPVSILCVAWWLVHRSKNPKLAMATVIMPAAVIATAVANNVIVAAKKVEKVAKKVTKTAKPKT